MKASAFQSERQNVNYHVNLVDPVRVFVCYVFVFHCILSDRINRISSIFLHFCLSTCSPSASPSGEAGGDERQKIQSAFGRRGNCIRETESEAVRFQVLNIHSEIQRLILSDFHVRLRSQFLDLEQN